MIAKVRIAPVEQWCWINKRDLADYPSGHQLVGMEVEIHADRMETGGDGCGGRVWPVSEESFRKINNIEPATHGEDFWLCEHMLEMD